MKIESGLSELELKIKVLLEQYKDLEKQKFEYESKYNKVNIELLKTKELLEKEKNKNKYKPLIQELVNKTGGGKELISTKAKLNFLIKELETCILMLNQ